jgi:hypothetical protein
MRDWRPRLASWVQRWERLSELTRDCFPVRPSAGAPWPPGLPYCPALAEFYALCDGGTFGPYELLPLAEVAGPADEWLASSPGLDLVPGRWLRLGDHEYGHALIWDADADRLLLYSPDDMAARRLKGSAEDFLRRLFHPSSKSTDETKRMWLEALAEAGDPAFYEPPQVKPRS